MGKTSDVKVPRKQRQFLPVRCHNQAGRQRQNVWSQTIRRTTAFSARCEVHTWHNEAEPARSCQQRLAELFIDLIPKNGTNVSRKSAHDQTRHRGNPTGVLNLSLPCSCLHDNRSAHCLAVNFAAVVYFAFLIELHRARAFTWLDFTGVKGLAVVFGSRGVVCERLVCPHDRTADRNLHTLWIVADALHLNRCRFWLRLLGPILLLRRPGN